MSAADGLAPSPRVERVFANSFGDLWMPMHSGGIFYVVSDDTEGFDRAASSNVAINVLDGERIIDLVGGTLNVMPELGGFMETGEDGATWKATGAVGVDGTLHIAVSRHRYGTAPHFIQQTWDSSVLSSSDGGETWVWPADGPTFTGSRFSNPIFATGVEDAPPGAQEYVWAVSNDGTWNNGSTMSLARARKDSDLGRSESWEFWVGGSGSDTTWTARPELSGYILRRPGRASMTGATWIPAIGIYCLPQWHYRFDETATSQRTSDWTEALTSTPTVLEFFTASSLTGPWELKYWTMTDEGWYNPNILASSFADGDPERFYFLASGLGGTDMAHYRLHILSLPLDVLR